MPRSKWAKEIIEKEEAEIRHRNKVYKELQEMLYGRIKAQGLTQKKLGELTGISESTILSRLKDPSKLRVEELFNISAVLDIDCHLFLSRKEETA